MYNILVRFKIVSKMFQSFEIRTTFAKTYAKASKRLAHELN